MKLLSFSCKKVNNILLSEGFELVEIGERGLIETVYNEEEIREEFNLLEEVRTLDSIDENCDLVIFDFLGLLNNHYEIKHRIFNEDTLMGIYNNDSQQLLKNKNVSSEIISIFKEAFKVIINKICRHYHPSKIVLLKFSFNEDSEVATRKNKMLKKLYSEAEKIVSGWLQLEIKIDLDFKTNDIKLLQLIEKSIENRDIFKNEKVHTSISNVRYVFKKSKLSNSNKLIIIFSAFSIDIPKYNYISFFNTIDCNKLFILDDFGEKGSYYLGVDGGLEIETSVMSLITSVMSKNNIYFKDVISVGSSKGGSAALYYGFKYGFGNVVVGAPQYKIGTYLSDLSIKQYAIDIFKEINNSTRITYDNLIRLVLNNKNNTKARILTSDGDKQYKKVLKALEYEAIIEECNIKFEKCEISNHGEISKVYPGYLLKTLNELLQGRGVYTNTPVVNILKKISRRGDK
ncbi:MAG: accessory Sec system protein Asp2 [Clostridium sp.]